MVADFAPCKEKLAFSKIEAFSQLIDTLRLPVQEDEQRCILCDIDSLPDERIKALHLIKECCFYKNQHIVILLGKNNMALFFALHAMFPEASWLLKHEPLDVLLRLIQSFDCLAEKKNFLAIP